MRHTNGSRTHDAAPLGGPAAARCALTAALLLGLAGSAWGQVSVGGGPSMVPQGGWARSGVNLDITALDSVLSFNSNLTLYATNVGSPQQGFSYSVVGWSPDGTLAQFNALNYQFVTSSLSGTPTVTQRWNSSNQIFQYTINTSAGMANSHTIGGSVIVTIPAGLGDGGGGAFSSGLPTNPNYQEAGGLSVSLAAGSPGDYLESVAVQTSDNINGGNISSTHMIGVLSNIVKDAGDNTYIQYAYQAISSGTQQTGFSPTAAYRVDGSFRTSLDLSGNAYSGKTDILFRSGTSVTTDATNMYFGVASAGIATFNANGVNITTGTLVLPNVISCTGPGKVLGTDSGGSTSCTSGTGSYTVATLPTGIAGARAVVTDATTCTLNGALTGGGSTKCPVYYSGSAWLGG